MKGPPLHFVKLGARQSAVVVRPLDAKKIRGENTSTSTNRPPRGSTMMAAPLRGRWDKKHNNKPYSGGTWRLGSGVTAAEVKTSHHRATRGTFRRLLSTTSPSGSVDWGRAKNHEEGENSAECRTGSRGREHSAAGEERSGRGGASLPSERPSS